MEFKEYQEMVDEWIKEYGVRYFEEKTNMILLVEEVGELARLIARKYGEQSFKSKFPDEEVSGKIMDEMGDILFVLTCLSNQMGINLDDALKMNIKKKTERDATRHIKNPKLK